jgi:hypothetical protein
MLRDKIVLSSNEKQQELLLREENLDFEKAIKICRAYEQSNKHVKEVRNTNDQPIHKVEKTYSSNFHSGTRPKQQLNRPSQPRQYKPPVVKKQQRPHQNRSQCKYCGYNHDFRKEKCPARGKLCEGCGGRHHFIEQM